MASRLLVSVWRQHGRYLVGLGLLLLVVVIWVASSELMQYIFQSEGYQKPFFLTYLATSTFSVHLVIFAITDCCRQYVYPRFSSKKKQTIQIIEVGDTSSLMPEEEEQEVIPDDESEIALAPRINSEPEEPKALGYTTKQTMFLSLQFCFLWFLANFATNSSLQFTSLSSSTIISSTSGLFTLALGVIAGVEKLSFSKITAVSLCVIGISLVSISDNKNHELTGGKSPLIGDLMSLIGSFMYGFYTVLLKSKIGHEANINMRLFFGFVGLFNIFLLWPGFLLLHYTGIEPFELPSPRVVGELFLNAIVGTLISDYLWLLSMLMTSPVIVTLGLSLTIPLAMFVDLFQSSLSSMATYWVGALLVLIGFIFANISMISSALDQYMLRLYFSLHDFVLYCIWPSRRPLQI